MIVLYPNMCYMYNDVCCKGTALGVAKCTELSLTSIEAAVV